MAKFSSQPASLTRVPQPIISEVISYLDLNTMANLSQVSRQMNSLVSESVNQYEIVIHKKNDQQETMAGTYSQIMKRLSTNKKRERLELSNSITYRFKENYLDNHRCYGESSKDKIVGAGTCFTAVIAPTAVIASAFLSPGEIFVALGIGIGTACCGMGTTFFCSKKIQKAEEKVKQLDDEIPVTFSMKQ
ncbi:MULTISPECIES: F-box protein [unclassified Legionella]|uniref:F-box protein n=1 Tax=unclassified Legionella TaxID=2622702 RepID=UPI00105424C8|nr:MULTISPECIES: F-box protein [unclassified Legionella]MDI9818079.1 F-box protein [Legionella sp. PL877]